MSAAAVQPVEPSPEDGVQGLPPATTEVHDLPLATIEVPGKLLTRWNAAMAFFHCVLAIVTLTVGNLELRAPLYSLSSVPRATVEGNTTVGWELVVDASARGGWLYLTWATGSFFLVCAFFHLGNALLWRDIYLRLLSQCYCPTRWIEYSISASLMVLLIGHSTGNLVLPILALLFALTFVTMIFGHLHEVICRPASPEAWAEPNVLWRLQAHIMGYLPQVAAWWCIVAQFADAASGSFNDETGTERKMPDFVYVIVICELMLFWSFGIVQLVVSLRKPADYIKGELVYQILSLCAKGLLGLLFLSNVLVRGRYEESR